MFTLTVVTPTKRLLVDLEVEELFVPAAKGELNILPGHSPLITTLSTGILRYRLKGESEAKPLVVSWGYCEVHPEGVNVLAETAETPEELDKERIHIALKSAEERLGSGELDEDGVAKYLRKTERARVRAELFSAHSDATH
jgi:F-type H+-transporting ATPase subunit epsilon